MNEYLFGSSIVHNSGGGGGGFSLACKDFGKMFDNSFAVCDLFSFFILSGD